VRIPKRLIPVTQNRSPEDESDRTSDAAAPQRSPVDLSSSDENRQSGHRHPAGLDRQRERTCDRRRNLKHLGEYGECDRPAPLKGRPGDEASEDHRDRRPPLLDNATPMAARQHKDEPGEGEEQRGTHARRKRSASNVRALPRADVAEAESTSALVTFDPSEVRSTTDPRMERCGRLYPSSSPTRLRSQPPISRDGRKPRPRSGDSRLRATAGRCRVSAAAARFVSTSEL
jgi:hypothetical protein